MLLRPSPHPMTLPESAAAPPSVATAELAQARVGDAPRQGDVPVQAAACRNCDAAMHGEYCASCGQRAVHADPTARELAHDAVQELLNVDGKILSTLRLLFTRPGFLTVEHLRGRRARYVAPIRLYLTCSVLYFLVSAVADPVEKAVAESRGNVRVTRAPSAFDAAQRVSEDSVASLLEAQGKDRGGFARTFFGQAARVQRDRLGFARQMRETIPKIFFVFVPLFAWIVSLVYR